MVTDPMRIKVVLVTEEEQVREKVEEKEKKSLKGKEKLILTEEKQKEDEEKALDKVKFSMRDLIEKNALMHHLKVDIIEFHDVFDLIQIEDIREIKFVAVEQIFVQDLVLYLQEVSEFVSIPFILFSSDSKRPNWQCLYKGNKKHDINTRDIEMSYIGSFMEDYMRAQLNPEFKESSHSDNCDNWGEDVEEGDNQVVEGGEVGQEVQVTVGQEVQIEAGHDQIVEGEAGHHVQAPEAPVPVPQLLGPMKLKKRWERDWVQSSDSD